MSTAYHRSLATIGMKVQMLKMLIRREIAEKSTKRSGAKKAKNPNAAGGLLPLTSLAVATKSRLDALHAGRAGGTQENPVMLDEENEAGPSNAVQSRGR